MPPAKPPVQRKSAPVVAAPRSAPAKAKRWAGPRRRTPADRARIAEVYARLQAHMPAPKTELWYRSPFELVVAVALSAQATDKSVNKATDRLYPVANTPQAILALGEEGLIPYIQSIGLYRSKAKNVIALSRIVLEQHGGEVPLTRDALQALPGVGRKTASVVLNELGVEPAIAVDTHVYRVSHRLKLASGKTPDQVEQELMAVTPEPYRPQAHHWLILHGRYTCVARKPRCPDCVVRDLCPSAKLFLSDPLGAADAG